MCTYYNMYKYKPFYEGYANTASNYAAFSANYLDISNNFGYYNSTVSDLSNNNAIYHYNDTQDPNTIFQNNKPKDIKAAINNDINEIQLYQNTIYITGIIACTTLLIVSMLISKK